MALSLYNYIQKNCASRKKGVVSFDIHLNRGSAHSVAKSNRAEESPNTGQDLMQGIQLALSPSAVSEKHEAAQDSKGDAKHSWNVTSGFGRNAVSAVSELTTDKKKAMRVYRWKLIVGLFLPFSIQALETTVLAGALPIIASDFNKLSQLNWIVSAFNLCSATFIPFWGQVADVYGRYMALQSSLIIMLVGSSLCSGAPTTAFPMLLVGRGLQGMGCAGLNIVVRICLADKVSLKENAKNNSLFTLVAGTSYGVGPVIGGYLTEVTWRWCFIINIPLSVAGIFVAHSLLRKDLLGPGIITRNDGIQESEDLVPSHKSAFTQRLSTFDVGGQLLFLFGIGLLVLALTWGGSEYIWNHVNVLAPLITGAILILVFIIWEFFMMPGRALAIRWPYQKAMIPLDLLITRNTGIVIYINFVTGMAMNAAFYFVALYFMLVLKYGASKAGTSIIYYLPGLGGGAFLAMFLCNVYPRQTWWPLFLGTLVEPIGITVLAVALSSRSTALIYGMLVLTGVGTGIRLMPGTLHGVGYFPNKVASIVSLILLSVALGGTFGMTIMLNIFNSRMSTNGASFASGTSSSFKSIAQLPQEQQENIREQAKESITIAFFALSGFLWFGCILMALLGNVDIGKKQGEEEEMENVTKGIYLRSLMRRRAKGKEQQRNV